MSESLFSANWYRVAELRPRLRGHAHIHRHVYRGKPWYVLEDVANQRVHRFTPAAHSVIGLMNGQRTLQEVWELSVETLADDAPTQDELIRLLAQLHGADVLQSDVPPDTAELLERYETHERQELRQRLLSPLAIKIPLIDPDAFLRRTAPLLRPWFGWGGAVLWLLVVVPAVFLASLHWTDLTEDILDRVMAPQNLVLIYLLFPLIKVLHEFGHGYATRLLGGEVHDMGVMLLVFTPVPYVDASSASAFPKKSHRALVAGGGMIAEVFVAALALYLWLAVEPGVVRTLAYNAMLIAGVTTLTFNANPLLRFDGYYILADLIEVPNLRQRANNYVGYLTERYAFGNRDATPVEADSAERAWLLSFAVAAFIYRMLVIAFILLFVFDISIVLGVLLTAISAVGWIGMPLVKGARALFTGARLRGVRERAISVSAATATLLVLGVLVVPFPFRTGAEGVIWIPDDAFVRAEVDGFVDRVVAVPGRRVKKNDLLITFRAPKLEAEQRVLAARLQGLSGKEQQARVEDMVRARMIADEIRHVRRLLSRTQERVRALEIRSRTAGIFVMPRSDDLPGRFIRQGQLLAHVVEFETQRVRAVVSQADIDLVRERLRGVEIRRGERVDKVISAELARVVPAADEKLPSAVLGTEGGGDVVVDPREKDGTSAVSPMFVVELTVREPSESLTVGGRVHVRFDYGFEPLAGRWYRSLRQLFLSRLDV